MKKLNKQIFETYVLLFLLLLTSEGVSIFFFFLDHLGLTRWANFLKSSKKSLEKVILRVFFLSLWFMALLRTAFLGNI